MIYAAVIFNIKHIIAHQITQLLLIVDLRKSDKSMFYIASCDESADLSELRSNFFIGFDFLFCSSPMTPKKVAPAAHSARSVPGNVLLT